MPQTTSNYTVNTCTFDENLKLYCPYCASTKISYEYFSNQNQQNNLNLYIAKCSERSCSKISLWGYLKDNILQTCGNANPGGYFIMLHPNTSPLHEIKPHECMHDDIKALFIGAKTLIEQKNFETSINLLSQAIHKLGIPENNEILRVEKGKELDLARKMFNFINNSVELLDQTKKSSTNVSE